MGGVDISVVLPVYNEEENLLPLFQELHAVMEQLKRPYEIIFVDDGSQDGSWQIISQLCKQYPGKVKGIRFRRNFGQTAALMAGFHASSGEIVITMDADRQNDPADIPKLLEEIEKGYDIVSGWRKYRKDPFLTRRLPSMVANWLISKVTGLRLHDFGCTLKAYRSEVVKNINLYGEMHRFIPAVASLYGVSVREVVVNHRPRVAGKSKYGLSRTIKVILDLLTLKFLLSYSTRPVHVFGLWGLLSFGAGFIIGIYLTYVKYVKYQPIGNRPLLLLSVLLMFTGIQLISLGLLAELLTRTYHESSGKRIYAVKERVGFTD